MNNLVGHIRISDQSTNRYIVYTNANKMISISYIIVYHITQPFSIKPSYNEKGAHQG